MEMTETRTLRQCEAVAIELNVVLKEIDKVERMLRSEHRLDCISFAGIDGIAEDAKLKIQSFIEDQLELTICSGRSDQQ